MKVRKPNPPVGGEKTGCSPSVPGNILIKLKVTAIKIRSQKFFAEGDGVSKISSGNPGK
jgi:hypothetical protein